MDKFFLNVKADVMITLKVVQHAAIVPLNFMQFCAQVNSVSAAH